MPEKIKDSELEKINGGQKKSRPKSRNKQYICKRCKKTITVNKKPSLCPDCGNTEFEQVQ